MKNIIHVIKILFIFQGEDSEKRERYLKENVFRRRDSKRKLIMKKGEGSQMGKSREKQALLV